MVKKFDPSVLKDLYRPPSSSGGEDNGQITIIGGSKLFHGAPLLSLKVASRIVDMVFFATPEKSVGRVAEHFKSKLFSFIWVPWNEIGKYIEKSDAVLIGPGFMRFKKEKDRGKESYDKDASYLQSREITQELLNKYSNKKWVIDAGSLQVMDPAWIPKDSILTPNKKEYKMLFGDLDISNAAKKYKCTIVLKGPITLICSEERCVEVKGGNSGMTKGGTGDVHAGLTVALLAKNEPFLAASVAAQLIKKAAEKLAEKMGVHYNADDLGDQIPATLKNFT